jgi:hypothetical protein
MKISKFTVAEAGFGFMGVVLVSAVIGAGPVGAETYRWDGSTAMIQQSGPSESQVTRYRDGQKIITQDGSSTDITIQRSGSPPPPDIRPAPPAVDRLDRWFVEERFSRIDPNDPLGPDCFASESPCAGDDFKRRMEDRMRGGLRP